MGNKENYLQFNQICEAFEYIHIEAADKIIRQISKKMNNIYLKKKKYINCSDLLTHSKHWADSVDTISTDARL